MNYRAFILIGAAAFTSLCGCANSQNDKAVSPISHEAEKTTDADIADSPADAATEPVALTRSMITETVRQHLGEMRTCYQQGTAYQDTLDGVITMDWIVLEDGTVMNAYVESSTLNDLDVENCLVETVSQWTFPAPNQPTHIVYPFKFVNNRQPAEPASGNSLTQNEMNAVQENLAAVAKTRKDAVYACYYNEVAKTKNVVGDVEVRWFIGPTGAVTDVQILNSTLNNKNVEDCIYSEIMTWHFEKPKDNGKLVVTYKYSFPDEP